MNVAAISGIGEYQETIDKDRKLFKKTSTDKVFLVENKNTIEVRTDSELKNLLTDKYESVMESRYFGRGGIEIVLAGYQLSSDELSDLIRLSYNLS
ncbi:hypothetical protein IJ117_00550 [Candidatus Saccharibacteria bacterium]|nr:hypothetical protein [Candidatus Saccharibacteria bacterium]